MLKATDSPSRSGTCSSEISFSRQRPDHKISDLGAALLHSKARKLRRENNPHSPELLPDVDVDVADVADVADVDVVDVVGARELSSKRLVVVQRGC
jgi:hypothetical protein